jgi:multidrug resistance efflux pump
VPDESSRRVQEVRGDTSPATTAAWRDFRQAPTTESFYQGWLATQCRLIPGVLGGALFHLASQGSDIVPVAFWGDGTRSSRPLSDAARRAAADACGVVVRHVPPGDGSGPLRDLVACPVRAQGRVIGAVAVVVTTRSDAHLKALLRHLQWGSGWLEMLVVRREAAEQRAARDRLRDVLEAAASALHHERFAAAAIAFVTTLATKLGCDRVSLGFVRGARVRVHTVSHTAELGHRTNLIRAIGAAMDEAIDQKGPVTHPAPPDQVPRAMRAHRELGDQHGTAILTVPFAVGTQLVGALTLERPIARPFDRAVVELVDAVAALTGPMLEALRRDDRWLVGKAVDASRRQLAHLIGPRHIAAKLVAAAAVGLVAFLVLATGHYRVAARAVMEAHVQRVAVAPFNGYVREAPLRAGDPVRSGQLLVALDDRELRLERTKWSAQQDQLAKQQQQALATRNAAQLAITAAQIDQARAQLGLIDEQLAKSRVLAGVDGVVVSGDLSQALGSPVERGQVLFHVAPLDAFRVVLHVDERDIADVAVGQHGQLLLAAAPDRPLGFVVDTITPVSTARDGRNYFRVEARLEQPLTRLQPGMEGVGKIAIDARRLVWIWLRTPIDWGRLAFWTWTP